MANEEFLRTQRDLMLDVGVPRACENCKILNRKLDALITQAAENWARMYTLFNDERRMRRALITAIQRFEGIGHVDKCARQKVLLACDADAIKKWCSGHVEKCDCGWDDVEKALIGSLPPKK